MQLKNIFLQRQTRATGTEGKCPWADFTWGPTSRGQHNHMKWQGNTDRSTIKTAPWSIQLIPPLHPKPLFIENLTQRTGFTKWHMSPDTPSMVTVTILYLLWHSIITIKYMTFHSKNASLKLETNTNLYRCSSFLFSCRRLECHTWTSKLWVYNSPRLLILKPFFQSIPKPPLPVWLSMIVFKDIYMCKLNQNIPIVVI